MSSSLGIQAYQSAQQISQSTPTSPSASSSFGVLLENNQGPSSIGEALAGDLKSTLSTLQEVEKIGSRTVSNGGDQFELITALNEADLALQKALAMRNLALQSYQEVMRLAI